MQIAEILLSISFWKYLPIPTLSVYCQLNKQTWAISNSPNFWPFLLQRDFLLTSGTKDKYLLRTRLLHFWSSKYPIMTEYVVDLIEQFLPEERWNSWYQIFEDYSFLDILTTVDIHQSIFSVLSEYGGGDQRTKFVERLLDETGADYGLLDKLRLHTNETFLNLFGRSIEDIHVELTSGRYSNINKYARTPLLLYIKGKPNIVQENLEILLKLDNLITDAVDLKIVRDYTFRVENLYKTLV